ncbi:hypothetical protein JTB14_031896 [Gonioctena quinquepunctata]|nr:hypothetical protein JTB14_031896 [Gonioctena quinquepunctata]
MTDKEIKNKNRGLSEEKENVVVVKCFDNKPFCIAFNCEGYGKEDVVKRWDDNQSKYIEVTRSEIIHGYNDGMGGVDLMDQLISYNRIFIPTKTWTPRVIMHIVDFALVNRWIEYKKNCDKFDLPQKQRLTLLEFRTRVSESMIRMGKPVNDNLKLVDHLPQHHLFLIKIANEVDVDH